MRTQNEELTQKRKTQIMDAAIICFLKSGFHNTGMKEICTEVNMSPGTLYHYFEGKNAIIRAIVEREQEEITSALEELQQARNFKSALLYFVEEFTRGACELDENILGTEIFAESTRNEEVAEILRNTEGQFLKDIKTLLNTKSKEKKIQLRLNADETARTIFSLTYGLSSLALLDRNLSPRKQGKLARKVLESIVE